MAEKIIVTDRYGDNPPDPATVCGGTCEGMGCVPIHEDETDEKWKVLWDEAEKESHADDGWHFVKCPECNGTGKCTAA